MREIDSQLRTYIKLLLKKWILLLIFIISLLGLINKFVLPQLTVPLVTYWWIAFISLFWVGFQIYREQATQIVDLKNIQEKLQKKPTEPKIMLELVEGNEYTYSLLDTAIRSAMDVRDPALPNAMIELRLKISNIGPIKVDVLSVKATYSSKSGYEFGLPWEFILSDPMDADGRPINFPVHLDHGQTTVCTLRSKISPQPIFNDAQFAARLSQIHLKRHNPIETRIEAEALAELLPSSKYICPFYANYEVSIEPLKNLYINLWQEENRLDLLRLAQAGEHKTASQSGEQ